MKHFLLSFLAIFFLISFSVSAQHSSANFWTNVDVRNVNINEGRYIVPDVYRTLHLKLTDFTRSLTSIPHETDVIYNSQKPGVIALPHPDGDIYEFSVMESPIMEDGLAAKFPEFKTFRGQGITDRNSTIRFDVTYHGFHAMVITPQGTWYIDPYSMNTSDYYISYWKKDLILTPERVLEECLVVDDGISEQISQWVHQNTEYQIGEQLRTYRVAVATTGEYTAFHGGTVVAGMSAVVTAMNRVNQIYENDVAIRMVLISNNDLLIYTNASTDPYTNNNGSTMLGQNQTNIDNVIGNANYDIGHVFSTGGGGVANLGVPCRTGLKARGVTGLPSPIGDPFYVDYVAHEMGHQWGANHTFNTSLSGCTQQRNASTAYEPGSGSTIMAYAGICGSHNLQNLSDDYFHGASIDEIVAYSTVGSGNGCAVITNTGNNAPVVSVPNGGWVIPINTPFELTGSATDSDNDALTYCWEQFNLGAAGAPTAPSGDAPIFRSFKPVTSTSRVFPRLTNLLNNTTTIGEILPSYTRNLTFRLTARDNRSGGGGVGKATLTFTANSAAGPFVVTAPNTNVTWSGNTLQTITWNVANTNVSPINTESVKILLSTDGGNTWSHVVVESTPNDGSEEVWVPNIPTTQARIKVAAINNVYFDISNVNFSILFNDIPVELVSFSAEVTGNDVSLSWITATETNNQGFEVERTSTSINEWKSVGFVEGKGTTTEINNYLFKDENVKIGTYSYRLKQVDFDGTTQYHNLNGEVSVENPSTFALLQNHPNPFNPSTVISYQLPVNGMVTLKIYDILGSEVVTLVNEFKEAGSYEVTFNSVDKNINLQSGVYFYQLRSEDFVQTKKMLLVK